MMTTLHPFILGKTSSMFSSLCGLSNRQSRPLLPGRRQVWSFRVFLLEDLLLGSTRVVFGWNIIFCNKFSSFTSGGINPWDITWTAMNRGLFFRLLLLFLLLEQNNCILYQGPWKHIFHPHEMKNRVFSCHNLTLPRFCDPFPLIQWDFQTVSSFWTFPKSNVDHFNKTLGLFQLKIFPF